MARDPPPVLHPHDRALLKPVSALGKPSALSGGVSFLRRTEYISSNQGSQRFESSTSKDLLRRDVKRRRKQNLNKEDPLNILRHVVKGFDVAYPRDAYAGEDTPEKIRGADITDADTKAWAKPSHPTKPDVQLLDSYPVLPDLDALPSTSSFIITKFNTNPSDIRDRYDTRLDVAILRPTNPNTEKQDDLLAAYETDLSTTKPIAEYDYEFYMTDDRHAVRGIKRKLDPFDPDHDSPDLYTFTDAEGNRSFKYDRIRAYETYQQAGDADDAYADSVALALHDPKSNVGNSKRLKKGAYFYPVMQRANLRPKRKANSQRYEEAPAIIDGLRVVARDPSAFELNRKMIARAKLDTSITAPEPMEEEEEEGSQDVAAEA